MRVYLEILFIKRYKTPKSFIPENIYKYCTKLKQNQKHSKHLLFIKMYFKIWLHFQ